MIKNERMVVAILLACFFLGVSGCGRQSATKSENNKQITQIGIAYALGGKGDLSYNDAASKGVVALKARNVKIQEFEPTSLDDYSKGLDLFSLNNFQIIFCVGYLYDEPVSRIAKTHPQTLYVVLDGNAAGASNVASIKFDAGQGSFLAGAVAAKISKSKKNAFIGGANIPIINEFFDGFREGAHWSVSDIEVKPFYVGTGGDAFTDPVKGREVALTAIDGGSDVLFHAAGSSGNGIIKAAQERGKWAIGVDVDQSHLAPGTVVTSMMKNFDVAMTYILEQFRSGQSVGGRNLVMGIDQDAVSLAPLSEDVRRNLGDVVTNATSYILKNKKTP